MKIIGFLRKIIGEKKTPTIVTYDYLYPFFIDVDQFCLRDVKEMFIHGFLCVVV